MSLIERIKNGFNVFRAEEKSEPTWSPGSISYGSRRPDRRYARSVSTKSLMNSIINRIGVDFSEVQIRHVKIDDDRRYLHDIKGPLGECLNIEPNQDQSPTDFRRDIGMTMLEEGIAAIVPVDTDTDPEFTDGFKIESLRVGTVIGWSHRKVRVRLFNEISGKFEEPNIPKRYVAIVENPFYQTMNEPNGTLQRLSRKMALMDALDEQIGAGKLDLIIQLPYQLKSDTKKAQAAERRSELVDQLKESDFGVAYTDATERVIQLNRPMENNLLKNVESLTKLLYNQLGITEEILNGTASEATMLNYQNRIIKPMLTAVVESMRRKFLSKTARSQGQSIEYFQDPFALTPAATLAELADKLTRNAILSSNEFRQIIGFKPVQDDPMADKLVNKNLPAPADAEVADAETE